MGPTLTSRVSDGEVMGEAWFNVDDSILVPEVMLLWVTSLVFTWIRSADPDDAPSFGHHFIHFNHNVKQFWYRNWERTKKLFLIIFIAYLFKKRQLLNVMNIFCILKKPFVLLRTTCIQTSAEQNI